MATIIPLFVFGAVLLITRFLVERLTPILINRYNQWQGERLGRVTDKLEDSFIFLEKKKIVFLSISPFIFAALGFLLLRNFLGPVLGFFFGLAMPGFMTKIAKGRRIKKFQSQLVDSLMILSSSLKAGLSLIQSIGVLCEEMPVPISQEFGLVLKENRWGVSLEESLRKLRRRMPLEEVNLIVSSVLVARETGGELTRVFTRLTETIRNNIKLKEKIATLTLQGRMQGIIMSVLPIAFTFFIHKQNPGHFNIMWESELGRILIGVAVFLQLAGIYLIKKISTCKV
ncbi:MAG: type II secretion system F family protein [Candidatus Omnitrophica bacterium]|nr:type II secretion system F family protein [Candidatus Omnitrophota bacterium]